ncbi:hypothetical protein AVEN_118594-1 [Araneus ventricosus]|uniref:Cuticle protein 10.9 n=1 Tax=Araneus ventricosus TaxID=182803 RepID=A0A4Y2AVU9_ARAVE|nr:hypothetical protein AVEN_118594-1 [Araneus ventricosus]
MSVAVFLLALIVSPAVLSHSLKKVRKLSIDDMPKKIVELIEFSMPSSPPVNEFAPSPYEFGYQFGDGNGMQQHRSESADEEGVVKGVYGYLDPLGVYRSVEYTADSDGYRAVIRTNEPGSVANDIAHAKYIVATPPAAALEQGLAYKKVKAASNDSNSIA